MSTLDEYLNIINNLILQGLLDTIFMTAITVIVSSFLGFNVSLLLVTYGENGLDPNKYVYKPIDFIINILRSIPFVILAVTITPVTKIIVGTSIGKVGALVPLIIVSVPYLARLYENTMNDVNPSLVEAALSFGGSNIFILLNVIFKESISVMIMDTTVAAVSILGLTAMAGAIGAGGLGAVAITYGHQSFNEKVIILTVLILIIMTAIIQNFGRILSNKFI